MVCAKACEFICEFNAAKDSPANCECEFWCTEAPKKPLKLMGTPTWLKDMAARVTPATAKRRRTLSTRNEGKVTGKRLELAESEHYSESFGSAVAALYNSSREGRQ